MSQQYESLLSPIKIGKFLLKNRLQSSNSTPHFSQGPENYPAEPLIAHWLGRANTGAAFVTISGMDDNYMNPANFPDFLDIPHFPDFDIYDPKCQNYFTEMIEAMHYMGTLVSGSLFSANKHYRYRNEKGEFECIDLTPKRITDGPMGAIAMMAPDIYDEDFDRATLEKVAKSYGQRAAKYKLMGFDAVTIHMSYRAQLPGQLLSPLTNHRTDEFGGSLENRARFSIMIFEEIRKAVGNDMLIEIQFSGEEREGGYSFEDGLKFLKMFEPYVDIVQVRSPEGDENHPIPFELNPTPFLDLASRVKAQGFDFLVSNVGGFFDPKAADEAIREGKLDLVAMARAWISNPNYGDLLYEGRPEDIVPCLRCNKCHGRGQHDVFVSTCSVNPHYGFEVVDKYIPKESGKKKKIAVIGGGPGGMQAAIQLADKGHDVTLYEATDKLGGATIHSDYVNFKWTLKQYKDFLINQTKKRDIKIVMNTRVNAEMIKDQYDAIVAAVGAEPVIPNIPGINSENVFVATDAIMNPEKIGENVVVIGGGEVGVETAMYFAQMGKNATVIEMRDMLAADSTFIHYREMFKEAWEKLPNFHSVVNATAKSIESNSVIYTDKDGAEHELKADSVVLSVGMRSKKDEALSFYGASDHFYLIGDCYKPGTIQTTTRSAYVTAARI